MNRRRALMAAAKEDLLLNDLLTLDGIRNTRSGHNSSTSTWEDLSGNQRDFTVKSGGTVVWGSDHVIFDAVRKALIRNENIIGSLSTMTIEIITQVTGDHGYQSGTTHMGALLVNGPDIAGGSGVLRYYGYRSYSGGTLSDNGISATYSNMSANTLGYMGGMANIRYLAYTFTGTKVYRYRDGVLYSSGTNPNTLQFPNGNTITKWAIGNSYDGYKQGFNGNVFRIGISSYAMTAEEIADRYTYFKSRFSMP